MGENLLSGWSGMQDASAQSQDPSQQMMGNQMMDASAMGAPPMNPNQMPSYAQPSAVNGYPQFSSAQATTYSPSGYAANNPVDSTPSVIAQQVRALVPPHQPMNPSTPMPATMNPWNVKQSSTGGSFDYPLPGQNTPPPRINTL